MSGCLVPSTPSYKACQTRRERRIRVSPAVIDAFCRREFLLTLSMLPLVSRRLRGQEASASQTVEEHIRQLAAKAPLTMKFRGTSLRDCRAWQGAFGTKLRSLLGPHQPPQEWKVIVRQVTELEDHRREELTLTAEGHSPLPVYLLVPRGEAKRSQAFWLFMDTVNMVTTPLRGVTTSPELQRPFAPPTMTMDASLSARDTW
jgi:hypothetical protein